MTRINNRCPACLRDIPDDRKYCEACEIKIALKMKLGGVDVSRCKDMTIIMPKGSGRTAMNELFKEIKEERD